MSQEEEIRENQHQNQSICSGAMLTLMETASSRVESADNHSLLDITKGFTERTFIINMIVKSIKMTKLWKKWLLLSTKRRSKAFQAMESLPGRQSDALSTLFMYASTVNVNLRLLTRKEIIKRGVLKLNLGPMLLKVQLEHWQNQNIVNPELHTQQTLSQGFNVATLPTHWTWKALRMLGLSWRGCMRWPHTFPKQFLCPKWKNGAFKEISAIFRQSKSHNLRRSPHRPWLSTAARSRTLDWHSHNENSGCLGVGPPDLGKKEWIYQTFCFFIKIVV